MLFYEKAHFFLSGQGESNARYIDPIDADYHYPMARCLSYIKYGGGMLLLVRRGFCQPIIEQ